MMASSIVCERTGSMDQEAEIKPTKKVLQVNSCMPSNSLNLQNFIFGLNLSFLIHASSAITLSVVLDALSNLISHGF